MADEIDNAVIDAAAAAQESAEQVSETAKAKAAHDLATGANAATAAAEAASALAATHAAKVITDNQENQEWLRQHAMNVDTSLKELASNQQALASSIPALLETERNKTLEAVSALLTPRESTPEPAPQQEVTPAQESADEDARREVENKNKKKKRHFI